MISSSCHPERPHLAHSLCRRCYEIKYYQENREARRESSKQTRLRHIDKHRLKHRIKQYRQRYNITLEEFNDRAKSQNWQCMICQIYTDKLVVDHCHKTGKVRGLLCRKCNTGLGQFCDDPLTVEKALQYLRIL